MDESAWTTFGVLLNLSVFVFAGTNTASHKPLQQTQGYSPLVFIMGNNINEGAVPESRSYR